MTTADLAQAFRDAGDTPVWSAMLGCLHAAWGFGETAALAIAEARVREMWFAKGAYSVTLQHNHEGNADVFVNLDQRHGLEFDGHTIADCLHAALQAALEADDGI